MAKINERFAHTESFAEGSKKKPYLQYSDKVKIICEYFGVSELCASYLYHRRRRGIPWYKPGDPKYLEWTIQLQNAIIYMDTIAGFDWRSMEFGYEEIQFIKHNIDITEMPDTITVLSESNMIYLKKNPDKDGFIRVERGKINITRELNKMGLIPRIYCS
jgi:hypothetical protein